MAKIKEVLKIQSSYSAQVDLKREFGELSLRYERMSHYKPIKAHRRAFETIAEGAYEKNSKRCFILSGSYGTGKSHLLLMLANYFDSQSDTKEMTEFFKNYAESEENEANKKAERLKTLRKNSRYLVCICDYGTNSFETYILRALKSALDREGIAEEEIDSYYLQAIKKIDEWKESEDSYFYDRLENLLENRSQGWTINKLKQELSEYNKDAIDIFKEAHKKITTSEFEYDKDNYVQIIEQLSKSKAIRDKFTGMLILFDEFDYQLKGKRFDLDEFQKFGQLCAASFMSNFPIIFVATTHRSFASYKSAYNTEDFLTVNDRIKEIPLETQGLEEIISAVVNPQKKSTIWEAEIKPKASTFNQLAAECTSLNIFNWLTAPKVRSMIIENIYPMHPMATFSLLKLASDVGSNNRSVFTFFAEEKNDYGSYDWFTRNNDIITSSGELAFYTVDLLFEYFRDKISSDNQELRQVVKDSVRNFETSLRELSKNRSTSNNLELKDNLYDRILKTMIIYQIIGVDINDRTLKFGLNMNTQTKEKELEYCLKDACSKKIIYQNDTNKCYEFRRSDALDINGLIRDYKTIEANIPTDLIQEIEKLIKQDEIKRISKFFKDEYYLDPVKYNYTYKEDKRVIRKFCSVKDIENVAFYQKLLSEMESECDIKKSYEGIALYVFCETEDEVKRAKLLVRNNPSNRIIIGIPNEEISILDDIFSLKAAFAIDRRDFSQQDEGVLKELIQYYDNSLYNKLKNYIDSNNLIYYGEKGMEIPNDSNDSESAATRMLERIYEQRRNKINHDDINKVHIFKEGSNIALREAVEILLDFNNMLYFRKDYAADRGDIKYIQNVLLQHGVIKHVQTIGNQVMCDLEQDTSKFSKVLPALAAMIEEIKTFDLPVKPHGFIEDYMKTYGIGFNSAILFFAVVKRYFKDSLIIMPDAHDIGTLKVTTYDNLLDILYYKKYKNAVMEYKQLHKHDEVFIKQLYMLFAGEEIPDASTISVDQAHEKIRTWYKGLDEINKVKDIYEDNTISIFIDVFNKIDTINPRDFILEEIKTIYGYDRQDLILEDKVPELISKIRDDKETIEKGYYLVRENLFSQIKAIFNCTNTTTYEGLNEAINKWLEGLSDIQRSFMNELQNDDSKPLVMHLGISNDLETIFMNELPNSYNLGSVKTWGVNKSDSYIQKIKAGKNHIEQNVFTVTVPKFSLKGKIINKDKKSDIDIKVYYMGTIKLEIIPEEEHNKIYITSNGEDPKDINSQRQESVEKFYYETREDKTIRFCGVDMEGKYSKDIKLQFINEDNKFEVKYVPKQLRIGGGFREDDFEVQVTLPKDEESLLKCFRSIIKQMKSIYQISNNVLLEVMKILLEELEE